MPHNTEMRSGASNNCNQICRFPRETSSVDGDERGRLQADLERSNEFSPLFLIGSNWVICLYFLNLKSSGNGFRLNTFKRRIYTTFKQINGRF